MVWVTVRNITLLCILASSAGLKHIRDEHPDLEVFSFFSHDFCLSQCCYKIWVAGVDSTSTDGVQSGLTDKGIITPGLGDAVCLAWCLD